MAKKETFLAVPPDADAEREENYDAQKKVLALKLRKLLVLIFSFALFFMVLAFLVFTATIVMGYIRGFPFDLAHLGLLATFAIQSVKLFAYALPLALPIALLLIWRQRGHFSIRVRKFIQYQFTVNGVAAFVGFFTLVGFTDIFVSFMQAIFINVIYGALAAIALTVSTNPGHIYSLTNDNQPILTRRLKMNIMGQFIYQAIVLFILVIIGPHLFEIDGRWNDYGDPTVHFTLVFNAFVFMSIFNQINARKVNGERNVFQDIHKDYLFIGIFLLELIIQVLTVQIGCEYMTTTPLNCEQWLWSIAFGVFGLLWQQVIVSFPCGQ